MKELNWNIFETKFNGKQQAAFERMAYALFCSRFNQEHGIFSHKNQVGIETEPITINDKQIGFQAKYLEPTVSFSSKKNTFIQSLEKAKQKNHGLKEIYFFVNKSFSESKKNENKRAKYIIDIEEKAKKLDLTIIWQVPSQIEMQLFNKENIRVAKEFFPQLIEKENHTQSILNKNDLLEITRTALIQIDIAKIISEFTYKWEKSGALLDKFYIYVDFRNEIIANDILSFLNVHVSYGARVQMPSSVAGAVHSLALTFFPSSYGEEEKEMRIKNGEQCIFAGAELAYGAFIYSGNYRVAAWGLSIWKFIYRESKRNEYEKLVVLVLEQYERLESTLKRPQRNDLGPARELVSIFKADLETYDISFPELPIELYKLVEKCD